jgi:hypothetical protein
MASATFATGTTATAVERLTCGAPARNTATMATSVSGRR